MANKNLTNAKRAKNDEFYTQFSDIQKEVESYLEYDQNAFKGKVIYSNCDDPFESNFFRYFVLNFNRLGLKRLISTSYKPSPVANTQLGLFGDDKTLTKSKGRPKITANKFIINEVGDIAGDGSFTLEDIAKQLRANKNNEWTPLDGDGDFRSDECVELLKQSDIVVTNPPFSLFRVYIKQLFDHSKKILIIGNMNAITYKEVFPLIKKNKLWVGATNFNTGMYFQVPNDFEYADTYKFEREQNGVKVNRVPGVCWFTNLDHGRRHQPTEFMSAADNFKYNKKMRGKASYNFYENYDAIDVPFAEAIPSDYDGVMGVPISFMNKYNPDQFEIIGTNDNGLVDDEYKKTAGLTKKFVEDYYKAGGTGAYKEGNPTAGFYEDGIAKMAYKRIFIKHKKK